MSITTDFINHLRNKGHKVNNRLNTSMGSNVHDRNLSQITHGGQHWTGANGTISGHENYWRSTHGWDRGGYTAHVANDGTINVNYPFEMRTWGIGNNNTYTLNFCYEGIWSNPMTSAQKTALTAMWEFVINDPRVNINSYSKVLGHNEYAGHEWNACPGIDMNQFRSDISSGSAKPQDPDPSSASGATLVKYENGEFTTNVAIKVRSAPSTSATHTGTLDKDVSIVYDRVYSGNGYRWLSYVGNSGNRLYLPYRPLNEPNANWGSFSSVQGGEDQSPADDLYIAGAKKVKDEKATFTVTTSAGIKVRNRPSTTARHTGTLPKGASINYDKVYSGNGYRWLSYIGGSRNRLYVPYRALSSSNQWGTFS